MTPEDRSAGLAAAARVRRERLIELADSALNGAAVDVVEVPEPGSILMRLDHPAAAFHFAEAIVTTAGVKLAGRDGWGCVLGYDREGALAAALLDAAGGPAVDELARESLESERIERDRLARRLSRTRV